MTATFSAHLVNKWLDQYAKKICFPNAKNEIDREREREGETKTAKKPKTFGVKIKCIYTEFIHFTLILE